MTKSVTGIAGTPSGPSRLQLLNRTVSRRELSQLLEDASLDQLLDLVSARYAVHFETLRIGEDVLECLQFSDMEAYIEQRLHRSSPGEGIDALPLWAKIWPASFPLAIYMRGLRPASGERVLEIGAGLGVSGLFAAKRGFSVVLSDTVPEALLFARINCLRNALGDEVRVQQIDFTASDDPGRFDRIIGSEVLYREQYFKPLLHFFRTNLEPKPSAEILLSADAGRRSIKFFAAAKDFFRISRSAMTTPMASAAVPEGEEQDTGQTTYLYRLRPM